MPDLHMDPALAVNEILHHHPELMPLLAAAGIDTCCGGAESLRDAARMAGADLGTLLGAMHAEQTRVPGDEDTAAPVRSLASYAR